MNHNTHIYLYAKGHYQKSDVCDDLKIIIGKRSMIPSQFISLSDIGMILLDLVFKHIQESCNSKYYFLEFMSKMNPDNYWKVSTIVDSDDYHHVLFKNCLSFLRQVEVKDLDLGQADSSILPLKESV